MEMKGEQLIAASQAEVWQALNDPEILKASVPGCESIERRSDTEYDVLMVTRVGPVTAKFKGQLTLSDLKPPHSYSIAFAGQGGAAGFAKGGARVQLTPETQGTKLAYDVKASVGGKLAQIGARLVDMAARKIADDFFERFKEKVSGAQVHSTQEQPEEAQHAHGATLYAAAAQGSHPEPIATDPDMPTVTEGTLMFFAAGSLVVLIVALVTMF